MKYIFKFLTSCFLLCFLFASSLYAKDNYIKINYGIAEHNDTGVTISNSNGSMSSDNDDDGIIVSAGTLIGNNWGVDLMYYDMGSQSITIDNKNDIISYNSNQYQATDNSGTISRDISGYGLGLIGVGDTSNDFLGVTFYLKAGIHAWDKSGSTTILDNDTGFSDAYFNEGIGAYAGTGLSLNLFQGLALDVSYDYIGLSNDLSFNEASTLLGAGLRFQF